MTPETLTTHLARPAWLGFALLPVAGLLLAWLVNRRSWRAAPVGTPAAVAALHTRPPRCRWLAGLFQTLAWLLLAVGASGPRWGIGEPDGVAVGRDVVLVLDLSRSMLADDTAGPARWQSAVAGALDLVDAFDGRGGHRIAVVVFAAQPQVLTPLTTDAGHLRAVLNEIDGSLPPPAIRPGDRTASGTRIGVALTAAVGVHDPRFPGAQDIILISDGDDPAASDREWAAGVTAARAARIPVHAVAIGDPARDSDIGGGVQTRLREGVLRDIVTEARGQLLSTRRERPAVGAFFRTNIEPTGRPRELSDDALPQPRDRSAWFLAAGVGCLLAGRLRLR